MLGPPRSRNKTSSPKRSAATFPRHRSNTSLDLLAADEQLIDRGFLVDVEHPVYGPMRFPRGAIATVWDNHVGFAPELGSANGELFAELGYTKAEQTLLFERRVL